MKTNCDYSGGVCNSEDSMTTLRLPTISSIITWANTHVLGEDVQYLSSRETPYIKARDGLYYYFKKQGMWYVLQMTSEKDLGVIS